MNVSLLHFRCIQIRKVIAGLPLPYLLVLLGMITFCGLALIELCKELLYASGVVAVFASYLLFFHSVRKDLRFIALVEERPWKIVAAEYLMMSLPLIVILLFSESWFLAPVILPVIVLISFTKQRKQRNNTYTIFSRIIPSGCFEWISGFRRFGVWITIFYLSAIVALAIPYLSFLFLFIFTSLISGFYCDCEPEQLLGIKELPARPFLHYKLKSGVGLYLIMVLPVLIAYMVLHPGSWFLAPAFGIFASLNIILFIVSKYAVYVPGEQIRSGQVILALSLLGFFIPVFIPVTIAFCIRNYIRSLSGLSNYLYAYNY